jgi:polar amino acid transport system substrate-binding protein
MAQIAKRGYLKAGVDQNTLFWGYREPGSASPQGFDVDMLKQVAIAIFGDDSAQHVHLIIVPNADRQQYVADGTVDLVAETMTITCSRQDGSNGLPPVDFSSEYYDAHQEVLVPKESAITSIADLNGKRVCAATTSTSLTTVKQAAPRVQLWEAPNETDCLVMLQQGQVDAISTDPAGRRTLRYGDQQHPLGLRPVRERRLGPRGGGRNLGEDLDRGPENSCRCSSPGSIPELV